MTLQLIKIKIPLATFTLDIEKIFLDAGEVVGLIGANGSGKTTLLKLITREIETEGTEIIWNGRSQYLDDLSYTPDSLRVTHGKVSDFIKLYELFDPRWNTEYFKGLCESINISLNDKLSHLSLGESQKLMFAIAQTTNGKLTIMDEPSDGLDPLALRQFLNNLVDTQDDSKLTIISTHQIKQYEKVLDRVLYIEQGQIILNLTSVEIIERGKEILEYFKAKEDDLEFFDQERSLESFIKAIERRKLYVG